MNILLYICCIPILIILFKYAFKLLAFTASVIKFSLIKKKKVVVSQNKSDNHSSENRRSLKSFLSKQMEGLVFFSILQTSKIPSHLIRNTIYKHVFKIKFSKNVVIYSGAEIRSPDKLSIGEGSIIGHNAILDARNIIEIGSNVNFSTGVWLWSEQHDHSCPHFSCNSIKNKKITIGNRAWLGPRVIVLPGINIGEGSVVGAGSVVTKDTEPFSINAGIPARKIAERNSNLVYEFDRKARLPYS